MADIKNDVFYYDKEGKKKLTTCDQLKIPEDIFHSVIDNLNATLNFVANSAQRCDSSPSEFREACERSIQPYTEAVKKYGYEFFIADISSKHEIINISCMLREV